MQGIWINGQRPKSKKQVKEAFAADPNSVSLEATSFFGNEYDGPIVNMPFGDAYFVGPDPRTKRNFYGVISSSEKGITIK